MRLENDAVKLSFFFHTLYSVWRVLFLFFHALAFFLVCSFYYIVIFIMHNVWLLPSFLNIYRNAGKRIYVTPFIYPFVCSSPRVRVLNCQVCCCLNINCFYFLEGRPVRFILNKNKCSQICSTFSTAVETKSPPCGNIINAKQLDWLRIKVKRVFLAFYFLFLLRFLSAYMHKDIFIALMWHL